MAFLSASEVHPLELMRVASDAGFDAVGLRAIAAPDSEIVPILGDEKLIGEILRFRDESGISVLDIEAVWLDRVTDRSSFEPIAELTARLGARFILVVGNDPDGARLRDNYAALCATAQTFGVAAALEFIPFSQVRTLDEARQVVSDIGAGTARYVIDVLHLMRSGDGLAGLLAVADDPRLAYLQLSDVAGPAPASPELLRAEARTARFVPGEGKAPLREILAALPPGMPISVEAPAARLAGLSPAERARILYDSVRALLEAD